MVGMIEELRNCMLRNRQITLIYLLLTVTALVAFWQVIQCGFINYDDPKYVTGNIHIQHGITAEAIRWAFTTGYASNWHPLTWMSHMLDVRLFGLNPRWHHLTNLLFHIANTLLLFFVFHRMTKAPWKSAFVAALFALHPLHVESVAWVTERKDVLSTFFWMLTMASYISYVEHKTEDGRRKTEGGGHPSSVLRYLAVLILFALGLMSKPMLVTLPFVLLLLDFWPLQRMQVSPQSSGKKGARSEKENPKLEQKPRSANKRKSGKRNTGQAIAQSSVLSASSPGSDAELGTHKRSCPDWENQPDSYNVRPGPERSEGPASRPASIVNADANKVRVQSSALRPLLLEKLPLFVLTVLSCIVTFIAQQKGGAVKTIEAFPIGVRIANAFVSYIIYIGKMVWPANLAVYYPHPGLWPWWQVPGAVLLLGVVTFAVIRGAKRFPYLAVGWLWFGGTLVPVIGIVQVGSQAMADRYTYVPLIGLFVMAAWGIPELLKKWRYRKEALFAASALVLLSLSTVTWTQVGYWRNNIALCNHSLKVASPSDVIYCNRGIAYYELGNHRQALSDYDRAIENNPKYANAYNDRGIVHGELASYRLAIEDFDRAIEINPEYAEAYYNRGITHARFGNRGHAIEDMKTAAKFGSIDAKNFLKSQGING